jgi:hypothetical protein
MLACTIIAVVFIPVIKCGLSDIAPKGARDINPKTMRVSTIDNSSLTGSGNTVGG